MENLPKTTKGVVLPADGTQPVAYGEAPLPELTADKILVKIHSAPINPSDTYGIKGKYPDGKQRPSTAGLEGSGLVIAAGTSAEAQALLNKKVCFLTALDNGSWGEYTIIPHSRAYPLPEGLDYEAGAMCLVNPLTVQGFLLICEENNYTCIAQSASASQVGKMFLSGALKAGIKIINFVRRAEQAEALKALGAEIVVNKGEEGWKEKAEQILKDNNVQAYFDPLAGADAGKIISLMPNNTTVYNYGRLTFKPLEIRPEELIFKNKVIRGYWLSRTWAMRREARRSSPGHSRI